MRHVPCEPSLTIEPGYVILRCRIDGKHGLPPLSLKIPPRLARQIGRAADLADPTVHVNGNGAPPLPKL